MPTNSLTTASTVIYDGRTVAEGNTISADLSTGRVKGYFVTNKSASADDVNIYINGQTHARTLVPGQTMVFTKQGKIIYVTASCPTSTASIAHGVQGE